MLALIPARGGSKGVPRKNVKQLAGKPAIAWAIEACLAAKTIDRVVVTTEDEEIAAAALDAGAEVPFLRPMDLATDTCPQGYACLHALDKLAETEPAIRDEFVLVQATSPLIDAEDIDGAVQMFEERNAYAVVAVCPLATPIECACEIAEDGRFVSVLRDRYGVEFKAGRRQTFGQRYSISGAITVLRAEHMRKDVNYFWGSSQALAYPISEECGVDIDTPLDFQIAEYLLTQRQFGATSGGH